MSSSSLDSSALRDILAQNAAFHKEMQEVMFDSMRDLTTSAKRHVGTPAPLEGPKPTVTQFLQFVEHISQKFSTQNCDTSRALDMWLKDLRMPDRERESSMNEAEKLRLWEVIHACIDKALTDTLPDDVQSSKDGLKLLNAVFLKVINPDFSVYTERLYKFFNATPAVPAANLDKLQSEFVNWFKAMTYGATRQT